MTKKSILALSFGVCISVCAHAQSDTVVHEIGINAAPFVQLYIDFSEEQPDFINPYMLTYEWRRGVNGLRAGIGLHTQRDRQVPSEDNAFTEIIDLHSAVDLRVGYVRRVPFHSKWTLKFGADLYTSFDQNDRKTAVPDAFGTTVTTKNNERTHELGVSPFVFLQVQLNNRISLATEVILPIGYRRFYSLEENSSFPEFNDENYAQSVGAHLYPATALFLIATF